MVLLNGNALTVLIGISVLVFIRRFINAPKITCHGKPLRTAPNTLPLVGNGILFLQARQKLFSWFVKCERLFPHETLAISVPSLPPGVIISDPRNLDFVFKNEGVFEKGAFFKDRSWDLFGNGIINVDGELWRRQRRAGLRFLSARNMSVLTDVALPAYLDESVRELGRRADEDEDEEEEEEQEGRQEGEREVVDLQGVVHEITTQLMGRMAYGMEMHADDDFTVAFEHASGATAERFQNPLWFLTELVTGARLRRSLAVVKSYGRRIVARAVEARSSKVATEAGTHNTGSGGGSGLDEVSGSLIQSLLDSIGDEGLVADSALNFLSAGRDTVAQALTWTFYLLLRNRRVLDKLRQALEEHLKTSSGDGGTGTLDPDALSPAKMPYLTAVVYEALRLYPPIPFEIKQAQRAATLPDGTFLPAGSVVVWCAWAMNRSLRAWGADADEFQPERWIAMYGGGGGGGEEEDVEEEGRTAASLVHKSAAEFPVFNGGSRLCLGKRMAELIAVQVVARFTMEFDFEAAFEGDRVSRSSLTLPMEGGLPVYVRRRRRREAQT